MLNIKQELLATLAAELDKLAPGAGEKAAFESPKVAAHGDFASTAAMQLAKPLKQNPRQVAEALCAALRASWADAIQRLLSELSLAEVAMSVRLGAATVIRIADMAITTINSISENPANCWRPRNLFEDGQAQAAPWPHSIAGWLLSGVISGCTSKYALCSCLPLRCFASI